jgi:hypothetical protein
MFVGLQAAAICLEVEAFWFQEKMMEQMMEFKT